MSPEATPIAGGLNVISNVKLWPAAMTNGKDKPVKENPLGVIQSRETVMLDLPEFVKATGKVWLRPTATLPKSKLGGLACSAQGETPNPLSVRVARTSDELSWNVTFPYAPSVVVGAKVTLKVTALPARSVNGRFRLLTLNPCALIATVETVRLVEPEFFILTCKVFV